VFGGMAVVVGFLVAQRMGYPVPLCGNEPVERKAPLNVHGAALPSNPPLTINSVPPAPLTVNVTGTLTGVLVAPVALMVIVPLYAPAASPLMLTEAVSVEGAVPLAGLTVSHEASSLAVKLRVPPPVLVTLIVWLAGLLPPAVAVKLRLVGLTPMVGCVGGAEVPL